ncbi:MAG: hypothetical protein ACRDHF_03420 [Tepidiformaceae bacterium]
MARLLEDDDGIGRYVISMALPAALQSAGGVVVVNTREWIVVTSDGRGTGWQAAVAGYSYDMVREDGAELLLYHWHPASVSHMTEPHLHLGSRLSSVLGAQRSVHLPTGHVGLHEFIAMLIRELGVRPLRRDWERVISTPGERPA